jgi:hypothetical protein
MYTSNRSTVCASAVFVPQRQEVAVLHSSKAEGFYL